MNRSPVSILVNDDMLEAAKDEIITVIRTKENQFTVSGKIWEMLNKER